MDDEDLKNIKVTAEIISEIRHLRRGDQLAVQGEEMGITYFHHGIFLGHEIGVADFGGANKDKAKVQVVDILKFTDSGKRQIVRINYPNGEDLPNEEAATTAEEFVRNPDQWGQYNLLLNNCEHFAARCKTGRSVSNQIIDILRKVLQEYAEMAHAVIKTVGPSASASISRRN